MMHAMRRGDDLEWLRDPERCTVNVLAAQAAERERAQAAEATERGACERVTTAAAATVAVATGVALMTSPVRAVRRLYRAAWVWYRGEAVSADVNADDADPPTPGGDGDGDGDAAAVERSYARLISAAKIPPAALCCLHEMKDTLKPGKPLPDWARRGYEHEIGLLLATDADGIPIEPEPNDWAVSRRRMYLLNLERTRSHMLEGGKVVCVLCGGETRATSYSFTRGDRTGVVPVVESDASFSYVAAMQRRCISGDCGCRFHDYNAISQLPWGERNRLPFSAEMANGTSLFIGKALEQDIALYMTKGMGAAGIAQALNIKAERRSGGLSDASAGGVDARRR